MAEGMVRRSIYLDQADDSELRQIAFELRVSKSDLIRAAIRHRLKEWRELDASRIHSELEAT